MLTVRYELLCLLYSLHIVLVCVPVLVLSWSSRPLRSLIVSLIRQKHRSSNNSARGDGTQNGGPASSS
jgi:hypothetical protein